jgi:hypothetical protein
VKTGISAPSAARAILTRRTGGAGVARRNATAISWAPRSGRSGTGAPSIVTAAGSDAERSTTIRAGSASAIAPRQAAENGSASGWSTRKRRKSLKKLRGNVPGPKSSAGSRRRYAGPSNRSFAKYSPLNPRAGSSSAVATLIARTRASHAATRRERPPPGNASDASASSSAALDTIDSGIPARSR